jgi:hypothetical protein
LRIAEFGLRIGFGPNPARREWHALGSRHSRFGIRVVLSAIPQSEFRNPQSTAVTAAF